MTTLSMERFKETARILYEGGVPCYSFPTTAAKALGALYRYGQLRQRNIGTPKQYDPIDRTKVAGIIDAGLKENLDYLPAESVYTIFETYGIPVAGWRIVKNVEDACKAARVIGFPVVVKAESAEIVHKSDKGGVSINLKNEDDVIRAIEKMQNAFGISGLKFLVQKFMPGGKELIAGVSTKKGLGHMVMFGMGGIYVEVLKDVVFKLTPVTDVESREMLSAIKSAKILDGVRGEKGIDKDGVADILQRVSAMVTDFPAILEMDMNPIMAFENNVFVVDGRIKIGN